MALACRDGSSDIIRGCALVQRVANRHHRRPMAAAHAGCANDANPIAEPAAQIFEELYRTGELAAEAVADPHGQWRRWHLVIHHDVEMRIERGDLVDLDER